jgi:hypothetical protein
MPLPSLLSTIPPRVELASTDTLPLELDTTTRLLPGETLSQLSTRLIDLATNVEYPAGLPTAPSAVGNVITQLVSGLQAKHSYRLEFIYTVALNKTWTDYVRLDCEI